MTASIIARLRNTRGPRVSVRTNPAKLEMVRQVAADSADKDTERSRKAKLDEILELCLEHGMDKLIEEVQDSVTR